MNVLILDGHPDEGRLLTSLLDAYASALPPGATVTRIAVRDLHFGPNLHHGYSADQPWEPDLRKVADAILECDHLVVGFPLWWGGEPAILKGLLDRILLPGFAFQYHRDNSFWDRCLGGRSADLVITTDTPPWYLRLVYGDPVGRRWKSQILGFCGFKPIRIYRLGTIRRGQAKRHLDSWQQTLRRAATTASGLRRGQKLPPNPAPADRGAKVP